MCVCVHVCVGAVGLIAAFLSFSPSEVDDAASRRGVVAPPPSEASRLPVLVHMALVRLPVEEEGGGMCAPR